MRMLILPNLIYQNHILLLCTSVNSEIQPHQKDKRSATCLPVPRFSLAQISGTIWIHHTFLPLALVYEVSTWYQDAFFIPGTLYQHTTIGDACSFLPVSKICTQTRHVFLSLSLFAVLKMEAVLSVPKSSEECAPVSWCYLECIYGYFIFFCMEKPSSPQILIFSGWSIQNLDQNFGMVLLFFCLKPWSTSLMSGVAIESA